MKQPRTTVKAEHAYFSSDWHLGHGNVIKYDGRPFSNIEEMDTTIIANFSHLTKDDHLFFLGDLSFYKNPKKALELIKDLQCKLYWVIGNHDTHLLKDKELCERFEWILPMAEIYVEEETGPKQKIVLCHYAMRVWNKSHHRAYHLYGHSHHSLKDDENSLSFDVGCNGWNYKPVSYNVVKAIMSTKTFIPIDHHDENTH